MRIAKRQIELGLTDRALEKKAGVSRSTIHRAKNGGTTRRAPMEQIASALELEVVDVDEFRAALRKQVVREAKRRGAPEEVLDEAANLEEVFKVPVMDLEMVELGAFSSIRQAMSYLDHNGRSDLVDKAIEERRRRR